MPGIYTLLRRNFAFSFGIKKEWGMPGDGRQNALDTICIGISILRYIGTLEFSVRYVSILRYIGTFEKVNTIRSQHYLSSWRSPWTNRFTLLALPYVQLGGALIPYICGARVFVCWGFQTLHGVFLYRTNCPWIVYVYLIYSSAVCYLSGLVSQALHGVLLVSKYLWIV